MNDSGVQFVRRMKTEKGECESPSADHVVSQPHDRGLDHYKPDETKYIYIDL